MRSSDGENALETLAARYGLTLDQRTSLERLLVLLRDDERAPTAIRDPEAIVRDHLADALVALELPVLAEGAGGVLADLGSGAGLPALPIAIGRPDLEVVAVESARRKADFIARAAAVCGADNVAVVPRRAEELADRDRFDIVCARALAPLAVVAEYAAPLLRVGGTLIAWRGRREPEDEAAAAAAAAMLGLEIGPVIPVTPYRGATHRHLHLLPKTAPTPARFPRRPGVARKRPLGA